MDFIQDYWIFFILALSLGGKLLSILNKEGNSNPSNTPVRETTKETFSQPLETLNRKVLKSVEYKQNAQKKAKLTLQEELEKEKNSKSKIIAKERSVSKVEKASCTSSLNSVQLATKLHEKDELKKAVIYAEILKPKY